MIITNSALRSSLVICHFIQQATSYVNVTQCEQLIRLVCATQVISAFRAFWLPSLEVNSQYQGAQASNVFESRQATGSELLFLLTSHNHICMYISLLETISVNLW